MIESCEHFVGFLSNVYHVMLCISVVLACVFACLSITLAYCVPMAKDIVKLFLVLVAPAF